MRFQEESTVEIFFSLLIAQKRVVWLWKWRVNETSSSSIILWFLNTVLIILFLRRHMVLPTQQSSRQTIIRYCAKTMNAPLFSWREGNCSVITRNVLWLCLQVFSPHQAPAHTSPFQFNKRQLCFRCFRKSSSTKADHLVFYVFSNYFFLWQNASMSSRSWPRRKHYVVKLQCCLKL